MEKLFGLPINNILYGSLGALALGLMLLMIVALRNRVQFKMGVRNITRHPAQTSLIVLGLMLATLLISAALVTGDTMSYSIKKTALKKLGNTDIIVKVKGDGKGGNVFVGGGKAQATDTYFSEDKYSKIKNALSGSKLIDGITPIITEQVPAVSPSSRQNVPNVTALGVESGYSTAMGPITDKDEKKLDIGGLGKNKVYINVEAAEKLSVNKGDEIQLFYGTRPHTVKVAGVFKDGGRPSSGPALVMQISDLQTIIGKAGKYNEVLISNKGDEIEGAKLSKDVVNKIKPAIQGTKLEAQTVKEKALKDAEKAASTFTSVFLVFGEFSMAAGVMLILLIFVMLAAERRSELGTLRALGSKRHDILKIFVFEGTVYAVLAAAVGAVLGLGVGWGMVKVMAKAFSSVDTFTLAYHFNPKSLVISYAMGVVTTFLVVFASAWKAGRVNIVRAIQGIPEPKKSGKASKSLILVIALVILGIVMVPAGLKARQAALFDTGVSFIIIGLPLLAHYLHLSERAAFTIAGIGLLVWWLKPEGVLQKIIPSMPELKSGMEMFFLSGIAVVAGAIWAVMYNSDILLSVVTTLFGRMKGMPPMLKIAVNYPMKNRFRTGMALAMFSLIVFTMVFMDTILPAFFSIYNNVDRLSGGFDIQASTGYANPITDISQALDKKAKYISKDNFKAIGSTVMAGAELRQKGAKSKKWIPYAIQGVDDGYTKNVSYRFVMRSSEYNTDSQVWRALRKNKGYAVVYESLVPAKTNYNMGDEKPNFMLSGFYQGDKKLPDVYIEVKDPAMGKISRLKVIGVLETWAFYTYNSVITSQDTLKRMVSTPVVPTTFWFKVKNGVNVNKAAKSLGKAFYENGMNTSITADTIHQSMQAQMMIDNLLQWFMGLGLVVGIAALGVIASRSVVERRQQIGMLRAIGFRRGMVQNTFILESSFVAILGIIIGSALGLGLSYNAIKFIAKGMQGIEFAVQWRSVLGIAVLSYVASLLTTYLPARQASKVYPAEALRYE